MQYYLKKTFILLLFCSLFLLTKAQSQLIIYFNNNTQNATDIQSISKLQFPDNKVKLDFSDGSTNEFQLTSIRKIVFNNTSRVNNVTNNELLSVYPNPATNYLYIKNLPTGIYKIMIFDLAGIETFAGEISNTSPVDVSSLEKGMYIILVNSKALKFNKK